MPNFICTTCGTQHAESGHPPDACAICQDERQYVKATGQQWTTLDRLRLTNRISIKFKEPGLIGVGIEPHFAIGQRALFLRTPKANVLWDCLPLLDAAVVAAIKALGGISAIAISHPHYYSSMVEWSRALGDVPIYLHAADRQWVMRPDQAIDFWEGETKPLAEGLTLIRCGGHFEGGTVLHWTGGAGGNGILLSGDIIQVVPDRKYVSFMYSYPNHIPLPTPAIERIVRAVEPFSFDRIYGAFWDMVVEADGKAVVRQSAERYLRAIQGKVPDGRRGLPS
jgi:glyoxylase-like metal-dependent hydrolase (beta-lactamase superfamily II)